MRKSISTILLLLLMTTAVATADPWPCDCAGGVEESGSYWSLLDFLGSPLENGDRVYTAWTGPDGEIDPPDKTGGVTGDDSLLTIGSMEYGGFFFSVTTWSMMDDKHPRAGDLIYCRIFDGSQGEIGPSNYYADSQLHPVENTIGETFFCLFPGDPGNGYTDTPVPGSTPVEENVSAGVPSGFVLFPNRPNPFNASTEIRYRLAGNGPVSLRIFNTLGQEVRRLVEGDQAAGDHAVVWNGRDDAGRELASGIYLCRLQAEGSARTVKMVLLR
jgi:hypothetical protein